MITVNNEPLAVEILDKDWNTRLGITNRITSARFSKELGTVGEGSVTIAADDPLITVLPASQDADEVRWRLWEGGNVVFAAVLDETSRATNDDGTYGFGGMQRGIELGSANAANREFNGWGISELFQELLRDNVGKAPFASIYSYSSRKSGRYPPINAITGDVSSDIYWWSLQAPTVAYNHNIVIDLGQDTPISAVRVVPRFLPETVGGGLYRQWYKIRVETADDPSGTWTEYGDKDDQTLLDERGILFDASTVNARYVKVTVYEAQDKYARLANVAVYRDIATVGSSTSFSIPWIENDDSGNVTILGDVERVFENGAFNGDGVQGNSFVSLIGSGGSVEHYFKGTSDSVYFTQGPVSGGMVDVSVDGVFAETITIPSGTWQYKGYEVANLASGNHTLTLEWVSGSPKVDYFTGEYVTSWRPIWHFDRTLAYGGDVNGWGYVEDANYIRGTAHHTDTIGNKVSFRFRGDAIVIKGNKGPTYGTIGVYLDGSEVTTVDLSLGAAEVSYQEELASWFDHDSYGDHVLEVILEGAGDFVFESLEGDFEHIVYLDTFYDSNLRVLAKLAEITNTWLRFNDDGSVDLLGVVGTSSNTIIREGENEGGTIISANIEDDYSGTASAVLAIASGPDDLPIKAFVVDRNAVDRMGLKVYRMDNSAATDAYLLTRQAWQELRERSQPLSRYEVTMDPSEVGDIQAGETTVLYAPSLKLMGTSDYRVGRITTEYSE